MGFVKIKIKNLHIPFLIKNCIISCYAQISDYDFYIINRVSRVLSGARGSYIDNSGSPCDDGYVLVSSIERNKVATIPKYVS